MKGAFRLFLSYLLCDWVATAGSLIATASAVVFLTLAFQSFSNPYYGIVLFLILPGLFMLGLLLIPIGVWRAGKRSGGVRSIPQVDISGQRAMRFLGLIALLTIVNITIISAATYKGVHFMDSNQFCGTVCHTVMTPQYTAYQLSAHSRVACVTCHIGPGAGWFVQYKLTGLHQVYAVAFNTYNKPLPAAIKSLRPSQDTCEQCHWPEKFQADQLRVIRRYEEDKDNTEKVTVLMMRIGSKIHKAHVGRNIEYTAADSARQTIPWVSLDGEVYKTGDAQGEHRKMDCIDCHNRPTHAFQTPAQAVDAALESGDLDRLIPFAKRDAVLALTGAKPLELAPPAVQRINARNIFPLMAVTWGTYPNNNGHEFFPGCFRCHDEQHVNQEGRTISQDCSTCHELLAVGEQNPEILKTLGLVKPQ